MRDEDKPKAQLINELTEMRQRVAELEALETGRKQTEEALRESEIRYKTLFEVTPVAIFTKDRTGRYTSANADTLTYWPRSPIGYTDADLLPPPIAAGLRAADLQVMETGRELVLEEQFQTPPGLRILLSRKVPLRDAADNITGILGISLDITERKQLGERLAAIYQLGQELTLLHNQAAIIQRVLETATKLFRFEIIACGLVNQTAGTLHYRYGIPETAGLSFPLSGPEAQGISVAVVQSGQALNIPDVAQDPRYIPHPEGLPICSELCVPIKVGQRVIGVLNVESAGPNSFTSNDQQLLQTLADQVAVFLENARLHTEIQRHAQELSALHFAGRAVASSLDLDTVLQQAMIEAKILLDAEGTSILLYDPPSNELVFATAASPGAEVLIGARVPLTGSIAGWVMEEGSPILVDNAQTDPRFYGRIDDLTGLTTNSLLAVPLMVNEEVIGVIETINKTNGSFNLHDLELLEALTSSVAVAIENARLYENLQEQMQVLQQTQAQLVQSEKMAAVGRLSASIAHEINNPLQAIQNSLTLLEEEVDGQRRPEEIRYYLGIAEEEIERISEIMHRLRTFYRPTHQKNQIQPLDSLDAFYRPAHKELQLIDLAAILKSVLHLVDKQLKDNHITVECNLNSDLPPIQGNSDHLKQVFLNLVLNAIEAMATQGGILHLNAAPDQGQVDNGQLLPVVCLEFSDTGAGISPEAIPRLFEPFFSTKARGSGLGLSICYKIIKAHRGQINVESQVEMGTTFTILLPLKQPSSE